MKRRPVMKKDQKWEMALQLQEELERERKGKSENKEAQAFLETTKLTLEGCEEQLRNKRREMEESKERHRAEIAQLKRILIVQHNNATENRTAAASSVFQNQNTSLEQGLSRELMELQEHRRLNMLRQHSFLKDQKLKHLKEPSQLIKDYDCRKQLMDKSGVEEMQSLRMKYRSKPWDLLNNYEAKIKSFKDDHGEKLIIDPKEKKAQGSKILKAKTKDFIREREKLHKKRVQLEIKAAKSTQEREENAILRELEQVRQQISEERKRLEDSSCKDQMKRYYAEKALFSAQVREEKVEREMLLQAFKKLQQEGSELPKTNLKKALPGRKLKKPSKTLEKEEEKEAMPSPAVQENEQPQASGFSPHPFLTVRNLHTTRKETPTSKKAV